MKRTGSIGSRVPPAVTSTRRPAEVRRARAPPRPRPRCRRDRPGGRRRRRRRRGGPPRARRRARPGWPASREVVLHRGVLPHLGVHRRADHDRGPGGEQRGGEQVVGDAGGVEPTSSRAVAGQTTTRSADCPSRVCGIGSASSNSDVCTGSEASAEKVVAPTKRVRPLGQDRDDVGAGVDEATAHLDRLVGGDAAGDAEDDPPAGEHGCVSRRRARPASAAARGLGLRDLLGRRTVDGDDLVGRDLLEGDRQRLAGHGGDLRRHDGAEPVAELAEVRVDLAGPTGTQRDQPELRVGPVEETLDRRVHHRVVLPGHGSPDARGDGRMLPSPGEIGATGGAMAAAGSPISAVAGVVDELVELGDGAVEVVVDDGDGTRARRPRSRSAAALSSRWRTFSSGSPRSRSRRSCSAAAGASTKISSASGNRPLISVAPWTSISRTTSVPGGGSGSGVPWR